jgi:hypothetical protein
MKALQDYLVDVMESQDCEFDDDGELTEYHDEPVIDELLKHLLFAEKSPEEYEVVVRYTVEAFSAEDAENKVVEEIAWGTDYSIDSVEEA